MRRFVSACICIVSIILAYRTNIISSLASKATSAIFKTTRPNATHTLTKLTMSTFPGLPAVPPNDPSLTSTSTTPRKILKAYAADSQSEGAGARVRRSIGIPQMRNLSPFLMLDHFSIPRGAGFPDHPHRGQETITYMLKGAAAHEDFSGNAGTISSGSLQFMTAGRGIVHAEMPRHDFEGQSVDMVEGMQLWVDLPAKLKMCEPRYRDLRAAEIPSVSLDEGKVDIKVISGTSHGVESVQELAYTPVWLLDVKVKRGGKVVQALPKGWNAFAYVLEGAARFGTGKDATTIGNFNNVVFEQEGDAAVIEVEESAADARVILVAGMPLDQKVVQYGPFVLNSQEEVRQALFDYQGYSNGFERARNWRSEIGKAMAH